MKQLVPVDHSAMRVHQAVLILILLLSFILNQPVLVAISCAVMLFGALVLRKPGFGFVYSAVLKPLCLVKPDIIPDHREPHLFAQGVGGIFLLGASAAFFTRSSGLGWILSWTVTALAALNLLAGFCVGCAMYYWLNQLRIPGFNRPAPQGPFPGMRPKHSNPHAS
jgi:hypothetical protein